MPFLKDSEEDYRPILTPLIDVVFLLIIFFLVSTEFIQFNRLVKIELPQSAASEEPSRKLKNVLELSREERLFLNGKEIPFEELSQTLKKEDLNKPLFIRADKLAPYGTVVEVMGICQKLGIQEIDAAVKDSNINQ